MIVNCPSCGAEIAFRQKQCGQCGYSFVQDMANELRSAEGYTQENPANAAAWIHYAYTLLRNTRTAEALNALDRALPLLSGNSLAEYQMAAALYATADRPAYAQRLLADGILYNLQNFREEFDTDEIDAAGAQLRAIADVVWKQDAMGVRKTKNTISAGVVEAVGMGTYRLAETLASPENQRLYPGSPAMVKQTSGAISKQQSNRQWIRLGIIALVVLLLFACLLSQCAAM